VALRRQPTLSFLVTRLMPSKAAALVRLFPQTLSASSMAGTDGSSTGASGGSDGGVADGGTTTSGDDDGSADGATDDAAVDAGPGSASFRIAPAGCALAHCTEQLTDAVNLTAPLTTAVVESFHDTTVSGVNFGLGCASNGNVTACSLAGNSNPHLVVYAASGAHLWDSSADLDSTASASAPIVSDLGEVIATDDAHVVRYNADGSKKWVVGTAGGTPISPNLVDRYVVTATKAATGSASAPISSYDIDTGATTSTLTIPAPRGGGYSATNSPGASGNRFYITTKLLTASGASDSSDEGELIALDDTGGKLSMAWMFRFRGTSGASPLVLTSPTTGKPRIYFDGDGEADASSDDFLFFCLEDEGSSFQQVWSRAIPAQAEANAAHDPRGGLWVLGSGQSDLIRLDENDGSVLQEIDVSTFVANAGPSSAMTITGIGATRPVMSVAAGSPATDALGKQHLLAIDLIAATAVWNYEIGIASFAQFPIALNASGNPVVFVPTSENGILGLASP
jgi:hypothetical protein